MPENQLPESDPNEREPATPTNLWSFFGKLADLVRKLQPGQQLAGIALLALAALIAVTVIGEDAPSQQSTLLIIFFAGLVALVIGAIPIQGQRRTRFGSPGIVAGTATMLGVVILFGVSIRWGGVKEGVTTIYGNLYVGERPIVRALVSIDGNATTDTTNDLGLFSLTVPRSIVAQHEEKYNGNVAFHVFVPQPVKLRADVEHPPVVLRLEPGASSLGALPKLYSTVAFLFHEERAQQDDLVTVRVIVDSVRVLQDGSIGSTRWKFGVKANGRDELLNLDARSYSDNSGENVVTAAEEGIALVQPRSKLRLLISGNRWAFFSTKWAYGWSHTIDLARIAPNTPFRTSAAVTARDGNQQGSFIFYFTILPIDANRANAPKPSSQGAQGTGSVSRDVTGIRS